MITKKTSQLANIKVDKKQHRQKILSVLKTKDNPLTAYGISRLSSLSYHQVNRRMKELRDSEQVKISGKIKDLDGAIRAAYVIV